MSESRTSNAMRLRRDLRTTQYPAVRLSMHEYGMGQSDRQVEEMLLGMFPEADPQDVESFMSTMRNFGNTLAPIARTVAPIAQRALPGIINGAMQGGMVAGPWGALAGAIGGGAISALSQPQGTAPAQAPQPTATPTRPVAQPSTQTQAQTALLRGPVTSMPAPSAQRAMANPAAAQLLALLSRPETLQALQALLMGAAGRRAVRTGNSQAAPQMFANALSELAAEAANPGDPSFSGEFDFGEDVFAARSPETEQLMSDLAVAEQSESYDEDEYDPREENWNDEEDYYEENYA